MAFQSRKVYSFGSFLLDPAEKALWHDGQPLSLPAKAFDMLCLLVENNGRLIDKQDLLARIWPDSFVQEGSLAVNISLLRKLLGEGRNGSRFIETIAKHGYRFLADIEVIETNGAVPRQRSIAILPFSLHGDASVSDKYLGLGLADALIMRLGRIKQVTVRPLRAVLKYGDNYYDPVEMGREMKVDMVFDGRITHEGGRIRVRVQLVKVPENKVLWVDEVGCMLTDMFACEDFITEQLASALSLNLTNECASTTSTSHTEQSSADFSGAYQLYLRGRYHWSRRTGEGFEASIRYFKRAIEQNAQYAKPHAGLADTYILLSARLPHEVMPLAKAHAVRALELDNSLAEAHCSLAFVLENYDWDWPAAERAFQTAIGLNPSYATAYQWLAEHLAIMGQHAAAIDMINKALSLDPLSLSISNSVARQYYFARQYDRAVEQCLHTLEMDSKFLPSLYRLASVYLQQGRHDEALAMFRQTVELSGDAPVMMAGLGHAYAVSGRTQEAEDMLTKLSGMTERGGLNPNYFAQIYKAMGDFDRAFEWYERSYAARYPLMIYLTVDPVFDVLRGDPRFKELVKRVGLI